MRALEMAIQTEFGIHEGMSAQAWEAVLDEIMSRAKQRRIFHTPSPESMVMDVMMQHNMKLIENPFPRTAFPGNSAMADFCFWVKSFDGW